MFDTFTSTAGKIFTRELLVSRAEEWRAHGLKIVMTNGCFDLLHAGHITSLENARALGNALIVAINSDASVRRLKGPGRPINKQEDRARVLAALACVDAVTIFDEDTASVLLHLLRPHVYAKGGDYNVHNLPERGTVESFGGRIVITPLLPGHSTTDLIATLK